MSWIKLAFELNHNRGRVNAGNYAGAPFAAMATKPDLLADCEKYGGTAARRLSSRALVLKFRARRVFVFSRARCMRAIYSIKSGLSSSRPLNRHNVQPILVRKDVVGVLCKILTNFGICQESNEFRMCVVDFLKKNTIYIFVGIPLGTFTESDSPWCIDRNWSQLSLDLVKLFFHELSG